MLHKVETTGNLEQFIQKLKDRVEFITEGRNDWEPRTIHSRDGKQTSKYKDWLNIVDEKGNRKH